VEFGKPTWIDIGSLSLKRSALKATTDSPGIAYKMFARAMRRRKQNRTRPTRRGREERTLT